ncbi:MAG: hypothetical protein ABW106_08320 [Steroidobacteraceae bacterium]
MSMLQSLGVALFVSLVVSSGLVVALTPPLRGLLRQICPAGAAENFWTRFTVVMLFVAPMLVALLFGLPNRASLDPDMGQLVKQVISATLFGAFATLAGIGWKLASLSK